MYINIILHYRNAGVGISLQYHLHKTCTAVMKTERHGTVVYYHTGV